MVFLPAATVDIFRTVCAEILAITPNVSEDKFDQKMRSCFGVGLVMLTYVWNALRLDRLLPAKTQYKHLLWTLCFLKTGTTEEHLAIMFVCDPKTYRKWVWDIVLAISRYDGVSDK